MIRYDVIWSVIWCREAKLDLSLTSRTKLPSWLWWLSSHHFRETTPHFWRMPRLERDLLWASLLPDWGLPFRVTNHPFPIPCQISPLPKASYSSGRRRTQTTPQVPTTALGSRVCTSWGTLPMPGLLCPRETLSLLGSPSINRPLALMMEASQGGNMG